ncbi:MAG: hypothetical protein HQK55_15700 [Deltaproteobacteria bacterium]|nr:hypothetical protein [Deltaproteobacteria bacterium]
MKIISSSVFLVRWPFSRPVQHSLACNEATQNLVVKLTSESGRSGFGEGIPRPYVTGETLDASIEALRRDYLPALMKQEFSPDRALGLMSDIFPESFLDRRPASACALETALWDLAGKIQDQPAVNSLGPVRSVMTYSGVIPFDSLGKLSQVLTLIQSLGLKEIKFKVGGEHDLETAAMIRHSLGPEIRLRADANGAWEPEEAVRRIEALNAFNLEAVEQPVPKEQVSGLAYVKERVKPLILADESICTQTEAKTLIAHQAVDGFNLRLSKCGGPWRTLKLLDLARQAGLVCMLGCQVGELGLLSAAGRHFAATQPDLIYLEGCLTKLILDSDIITDNLLFSFGGQAFPLTGPGLGVTVDESRLVDSFLFRL